MSEFSCCHFLRSGEGGACVDGVDFLLRGSGVTRQVKRISVTSQKIMGESGTHRKGRIRVICQKMITRRRSDIVNRHKSILSHGMPGFP